MFTQLKSLSGDLVHLFLPHTCAGCGDDILAKESLLCLRCMSKLPVTNFFKLPGNPVEQTFYGRMPVKNGGAAYFFSKDSLLQHLIVQLKYHGNKGIGEFLGSLMGQMIKSGDRFDNIDVIIPLPLNE